MSTIATAWKPKNLIFFSKFWNWWDWILSVPRESVPQEKKSPWLHLHQSYIINWYINGKVFSSTSYSIKTQNYIYFISKKFKIDRIEFCPYPEKRNHSRFVNISPTLVIDTTMRMSLWEATTSWKPKNLIFFVKKFEIEFCPYSECP